MEEGKTWLETKLKKRGKTRKERRQCGGEYAGGKDLRVLAKRGGQWWDQGKNLFSRSLEQNVQGNRSLQGKSMDGP